MNKEITTKSKLSEMALTAAMELEKMRKSTAAETSEINAFLEAVKSHISNTSENSVIKDSTFYPAYSYALSKSNNDNFTPREEFIEILKQTLNTDFDSDDEIESIESVQNFCLAVHEALISELMGRRIINVKHDDRIRGF
jgi:CRISPR/Cas system CSM-associated protein Csm2 small subunit